MIDMQIQIRQPVEVNLTEFPIDQLQMIQQQLRAELRDRELATYKQNTQLRQKNAELTIRFQTKAKELRTYEEREHDLYQALQSIALELPQCNIEFSLPLMQKVRIFADRAKALEETVTKMEEDHKAQIAELESRPLGTPQEDKEARVEAFRLTPT